MKAFVQYLRDVRAELTHVSWPTTPQAMGFTVLVVAIVIIVSVLLGISDYVFSLFIRTLL